LNELPERDNHPVTIPFVEAPTAGAKKDEETVASRCAFWLREPPSTSDPSLSFVEEMLYAAPVVSSIVERSTPTRTAISAPEEAVLGALPRISA